MDDGLSKSNSKLTLATTNRLDIQKKKHELSLNLTPSTAKNPFFEDAPTPSRILSSLDPELFQELHADNPFEATFWRANSLSNSRITIPEASQIILSLPDTEPLNTPSITITNDVDTPTILHDRNIMLPKKLKIIENEITSETFPFSPDIETPLLPEPKENKDDNNNNENDRIEIVTSESKIEKKVHKKDTISNCSSPFQFSVAQTPVITSVGCTSKINIGTTTCVPTAVVTHTASTASSSLKNTVKSVPVIASSTYCQPKVILPTQTIVDTSSCQPAPVVQLVIQIADGQNLPIRLPITIASSFGNTQVIQSVPSISPKTVNSSVKMKLKERLAMAKRNEQIGNTTIISTHEKFQNGVCDSHQESSIKTGIKGNKMNIATAGRHKEVLMEPEERRKKSLERNRAAATRCRLRRKMWISNVEQKAEDLATINSQLQNEVTMLRNEVAHLKTMLLAHKDCPVTQQQKAAGFINSQEDAHTSHQTVEEMDIITNSSEGSWNS